MNTIQTFNFQGLKALVRVDFNVPLDENFQITDDTRIVSSLPTITKILNDGGSVILMTHFGRPKSMNHSVALGSEEKYSTIHLLPRLKVLFPGIEILFAEDCGSEEAYKMAKNLKPKEILLLENTRFYAEETSGDVEFAQLLATLGDVYVNDAFGSAHRAHASTAIIADFFSSEQKMFGFLMQKEVDNADKVLKSNDKPMLAILGGAKISDKILILQNLLDTATHIIIGGGMAYTFIKAKGGQIGNSLFEEDRIETCREILKTAEEKGVKIILPLDSTIADKFANEATLKVCASSEIPEGWMGLDIGPKAVEAFTDIILRSKTILWNGPMGVFEMENFSKGTEEIAKLVAKSTSLGCFSLVGGGDSVAAVTKFELQDQVSFISTGGGALLEYFEGKTLPGIKAIRNV
ncbi:MAG: phosphoglycerate kinase [Chitinophagales bacterium]|jgi:phosphoglycerate kinase|nr:phosphoglycerate kinase [Chitinophagales bacterium]